KSPPQGPGSHPAGQDRRGETREAQAATRLGGTEEGEPRPVPVSRKSGENVSGGTCPDRPRPGRPVWSALAGPRGRTSPNSARGCSGRTNRSFDHFSLLP